MNPFDALIGKYIYILDNYELVNRFLIMDCNKFIQCDHDKLMLSLNSDHNIIIEFLEQDDVSPLKLTNNSWFNDLYHDLIINVASSNIKIKCSSTDYSYGHSIIVYTSNEFIWKNRSIYINLVLFKSSQSDYVLTAINEGVGYYD